MQRPLRVVIVASGGDSERCCLQPAMQENSSKRCICYPYRYVIACLIGDRLPCSALCSWCQRYGTTAVHANGSAAADGDDGGMRHRRTVS